MKEATIKFIITAGILLFPLYCFAAPAPPVAYSDAWIIDPAIPDYDPLWQDIRSGWDKHWDGKNLDELIVKAEQLQVRYPDKVDPCLWLARLHLAKKNYKDCEKYAVKAHSIDQNNLTAFKIMICALPFIGGGDYLMDNYGDWAKAVRPLPTGRMIPDMPQYPQWQDTLKLWDAKADINKGMAAVKLFEQMADSNPKDAKAQAWACRANYEIGAYFTSIKKHDSKAMAYYERGMQYGDKALALEPNMIAAVYWRALNLSRSIQYKSTFQQAKHLTSLVRDLRFCLYENTIYNSFGPFLSLATMITNGGWVAEKGMAMIGFKIEYAINGLELVEILYPDRLYALYGKADILAYRGNDDDAEDLLEKVIDTDPNLSTVLELENMSCINFSKMLLADLEKK